MCAGIGRLLGGVDDAVVLAQQFLEGQVAVRGGSGSLAGDELLLLLLPSVVGQGADEAGVHCGEGEGGVPLAQQGLGGAGRQGWVVQGFRRAGPGTGRGGVRRDG